jgi:hypothetical protein
VRSCTLMPTAATSKLCERGQVLEAVCSAHVRRRSTASLDSGKSKAAFRRLAPSLRRLRGDGPKVARESTCGLPRLPELGPTRSPGPRLSGVGIQRFRAAHKISTGSMAPVFEPGEFGGLPSFRCGKSPEPVLQPWQSRRSTVARPTAVLTFAILPPTETPPVWEPTASS